MNIWMREHQRVRESKFIKSIVEEGEENQNAPYESEMDSNGDSISTSKND